MACLIEEIKINPIYKNLLESKHVDEETKKQYKNAIEYIKKTRPTTGSFVRCGEGDRDEGECDPIPFLKFVDLNQCKMVAAAASQKTAKANYKEAVKFYIQWTHGGVIDFGDCCDRFILYDKDLSGHEEFFPKDLKMSNPYYF